MYYLSRPVEEEARIHIQEAITDIYAESLKFLKELSKKYKLKNSPDGRIHLSPNAYDSPDKLIKVEEQFNRVMISFQGVPLIKENRWEYLISAIEQAISLPNICFKVDIAVVNYVLQQMDYPTEIVYKAILKICEPYLIEEMTYKVLQAQNVPTQDELELNPNVFLEDEYNYRIMPSISLNYPQELYYG